MGPGVEQGKLKDPALQALVKELGAQNMGLCLITSRIVVTDLEALAGDKVQAHGLDHLSAEAGAELLTPRVAKGSEEELRAAAKEYDGHSFALTLLGTYIRKAHKGDIRKRIHIPLEGKPAHRMMATHAQGILLRCPQQPWQSPRAVRSTRARSARRWLRSRASSAWCSHVTVTGTRRSGSSVATTTSTAIGASSRRWSTSTSSTTPGPGAERGDGAGGADHAHGATQLLLERFSDGFATGGLFLLGTQERSRAKIAKDRKAHVLRFAVLRGLCANFLAYRRGELVANACPSAGGARRRRSVPQISAPP
jgi:hypothetical protein